MADVSLSVIKGKPRMVTYKVTTSKTLPIPSWAQGGKGYALVNAVGGGGSGCTIVSATTGYAGSGGGGAGAAVDARLNIPAGDTSITIAIGAGGGGTTATSSTAGNDGGDTLVYTSQHGAAAAGGKGAPTNGGGVAGGFFYYDPVNDFTYIPGNGAAFVGLPGESGQNGANPGPSVSAGYGGGSRFGPGAHVPSEYRALTTAFNGVDATSPGGGGSGARATASIPATSGKGADGVAYITFVEGVAG